MPAGQVTGNGAYTIGGVGGSPSTISGLPDGQGASLVVVYQPSSAPVRAGRICASAA